MAQKYKVGDRVRIKSIDWYNENKDEDGIVELSTHIFTPGMSQFCGKVVTIEDVFEDIDDNVVYYIEEIDYDWTDEMIEGLVEEEIIDIDDFQDDNEIIDVIDEYVHRLKNNECQINLPEGYQFTDENGNVINATKIVLEKKKMEYPKTFEECVHVLEGENRMSLEQMNTFRKLIDARNAYWKIYGEENGLGKPWEPDYTKERYIIYKWVDEIFKGYKAGGFGERFILEFPTAEMRDVFKENFDPDIEICKEFL